MACNGCSSCSCGADAAVTGGFGSGFQAFLDENPDVLGRADDLLWELAAGQVVMDPNESLDVWEDRVRTRFALLKNGLKAAE